MDMPHWVDMIFGHVVDMNMIVGIVQAAMARYAGLSALCGLTLLLLAFTALQQPAMAQLSAQACPGITLAS